MDRVRRLDARPDTAAAAPRRVDVGRLEPHRDRCRRWLVWVANAGGSTVDRFDPSTFAEGPIKTISVGRRPTGIAYGEGAVWVANLEDDSVTRIDPDTYSGYTIPVADEPVAVAVGAGGVWVASASGTVSRIDPARRAVVKTIETGNAPAGIAAGRGFVWVTVQKP